MVDRTSTIAISRANWYDPDEALNPKPDSGRWRFSTRQHVWRPPTDVFEIEEALVVRVEVAGMQQADFQITIEDQTLLVHGVRPDTPERKAYHQLEIPFGEFSTLVELPFPIVSDEVAASYHDGFLRVVLPKARPYQVQVEDD